jgi:dUTP pyrophosphatase
MTLLDFSKVHPDFQDTLPPFTNRKPTILFKRLSDNVQLPTYGTTLASCFDFYSPNEAPILIGPGETLLVKTGLEAIIPAGYSLRLHARSGLAVKSGIVLANGQGIVDEDYREEIGIALRNTSTMQFRLDPQTRIAQGELVLDVRADVQEYYGDVYRVSERSGGFGSTGVH